MNISLFTLVYPSFVFLFCVVCLSFAMITYSMGVYVVGVVGAPLDDEEPSFRLIEGFCGNHYKWVVCA